MLAAFVLTTDRSKHPARDKRGVNGIRRCACSNGSMLNARRLDIEADITVTLPKSMTSGAKSDGRFGKQDFVYIAEEDVFLGVRPASG